MPPRAAANGTAAPAEPDARSRSSSPEYNPAAFQASLDDSVHAARSLVESWIPSNLGHEWSQGSQGQTGAAGLQGLKDRARLPRLGLGAQPAAAQKQFLEDRKLKNRLLGKSAAYADEGASVRAVSTPGQGTSGDLDAGESDDDDEEDSRASAVGKKPLANGVSARNAYANPFVIPPKAGPSTPAKQAGATGKALFNDPSPAKASSSSAATTSGSASKPLLGAPAAGAFYGDGAAPSTSAAPSTKNKRKKERERVKRAEEQRAREEESRREEQAAAGQEVDESLSRKRARENEDGEAEDGEAAEEGERDDADTAGPSGAPSAEKVNGTAGGDSPGKKKRRKKKKKGSTSGASAGPAGGALLNLAPLAEGK
ncbi:uncharacterized protein JCM10292_003414 [Rhodotorula paludigena]|uniref:uncharacterized protein n=1 Tax=Rhodotorula paludigena TaxID=86838 RepID=UPI00317E4975